MNDEYYMKMALDLAEKGRGFTSPNPMVGAVVVKDDRICGKGYHPAAGKPHAEVVAIDDAGSECRGATLYVTLEPCNHTGRTPPCTEKVLKAGIKRVVVAMRDPNPDVIGGGIAFLQKQGIEVTCGVHEPAARKQNEYFIKYIQTKRPFVMVKCAATLDGQIATRSGDSKWVTGSESRAYVHQIRHAVDGIMVGVGTVLKDDPSLTTRLEHMRGVDPVRIILDSHLSMPEDAKVLRLDSDSDTIVVATEPCATAKKKRLEKQGAEIVVAPSKSGRIDLEALMGILGVRGITSILIEGGGRVIASALSANIVDKFMIFYAPKLMGGDDGISICCGPGPEFMRGCRALTDIQVRRFGDDVMIEGYISR